MTVNRPIMNVDEVELAPRPQAFAPTGTAAERFEAKMGFVGRRIGAKRLGYNVTAVPPGKRAFPFHGHRVNEEMFFVLAGEGEVRIGDARYPIREGDIIACPPGGPETAHQIINTSDGDELRYLAVSTMLAPEIADYPDSGKFGVLSDDFRFVGKMDDMRDYWEGE